MPILWLFVRFLKKAGGFAGPPALQWVYSILAFCRGQGKRRAPAVQTLRSTTVLWWNIFNTGHHRLGFAVGIFVGDQMVVK